VEGPGVGGGGGLWLCVMLGRGGDLKGGLF
jgi:hypothetical protein